MDTPWSQVPELNLLLPKEFTRAPLSPFADALRCVRSHTDLLWPGSALTSTRTNGKKAFLANWVLHRKDERWVLVTALQSEWAQAQ